MTEVSAEVKASGRTGRKPERPSGTPAPAGRRRLRRAGERSTLHHYLFAAPSIVLVAIFFLAPFVLSAGLAFTRWTGFSNVITFNGLDNFRILDELGVLWHAIGVTIAYAVIAMLVQNAVSLTLALAMQRSNMINSFFRSIFFIPVLISPLAAGYVWSALLAPKGPINGFLDFLLPGGFDFAWLGHDLSALVVVASIDAWKWSGLITLVYIAGLNAIPASLVEAAMIDGAGRWRRFWQIKWPLLAPAVTFNVVVTLVGAFSAFDIIVATTSGGPGNATSVLNITMYQQFGQSYFGTASALGFVVTVMVVLTAVPLVTWLRRREVAA
ncbi:multiple sugar transport system permease protein/raffinose/stachyose/melibiose transport system permease protein [Kibdelosporangium banguiense]|uniref:Multiple sugar transport system permease protein/raffinose/stachyose/melibiose transport system permease protein n=1 Tax=Kibdelosporangium banguiense TaxID=1365924 RepID=A0ABS4TY80_9PSEU|nr:sugar ABC transporter permease [Kibdelosporangium banguiense]MBP2328973.1 multiple sugar transport system permease protein/raffinose/stachyose/melibiose transport system permease protein [Kibdelosporangium banguiense]